MNTAGSIMEANVNKPIATTQEHVEGPSDGQVGIADAAEVEYTLTNEAKQLAKGICENFLSVHHETQEEISRARKKLVARLQEQLWSAACLRDYQLSCVQKAFDAEVEQIEREFEAEKGQLKEKLLADLIEHRRRLLGKKETSTDDATNDGSAAIATNSVLGGKGLQRKLRGKRNEGGEVRAPLAGKRRQLQMGIEDMISIFSGLGVSTGLGDAELYEDLVMILKEEPGDEASVGSSAVGRRTRKAAAMNNTSNPKGSNALSTGRKESVEEPQSAEEDDEEVTLKDDTLHCLGESFKKGDAVVLGTPDSSQLGGILSSLVARDVWIRIDDGAKLKITHQQLKCGRYTLSHAEPISCSPSLSSSSTSSSASASPPSLSPSPSPSPRLS